MTSSEQQILIVLAEAWNKFIELNQTHPDDIEDFRRGIHSCQSIMALREMRRFKPSEWPSHIKR